MSVAYVSGFIMKHMLQAVGNCSECNESFCGSPEDTQNIFIQNKEWSKNNYHLKYPSVALVIAVGHSATLIEKYLVTKPNINHLSTHLNDLLIKNICFQFIKCTQHKDEMRDVIMKETINITIPWWCKKSCTDIKNSKIQSKKVKIFKNL